MNTEIKEESGVISVALTGWLDTNEATQFIKDIEPLKAHADKNITIDCGQLEYVCSLGLRAFLTLKKESAAKGGTLKFTNVNDEVHKILKVTGFLKLLGIE